MENLNLTKILANVPTGTKLYCSLLKCKDGENTNVTLFLCNKDKNRVEVEHAYGTNFINPDGSLLGYDFGTCILFPSKDNRDWETFKVEPSVDEIVADYCKREHNISISNLKDMSAKLQAIIKMLAVADYLNEGWVPDWENNDMKKYFISFDNHINTFISDWLTVNQKSICYFKDKETAQRTIEMLGEKTIKIALS